MSTFMERYNHDNEFKQLVDDLVHCHVYNNIFEKIQEHGLDKLLDFFKFVGSVEDPNETINVIQRWPQYNHTMIIDDIELLMDEIVGELADAKPFRFYFDNSIITCPQYEQGLQTLSELGIPNSFATDAPFTERSLYEVSPLGLAMLIFDDDYVKKMINFYSEIYVNEYISKFWKISTLKSHGSNPNVPEINHVLLMEHRHLDQSVNAYFSCKHEWFENDLYDDYFISGQV